MQNLQHDFSDHKRHVNGVEIENKKVSSQQPKTLITEYKSTSSTISSTTSSTSSTTITTTSTKITTRRFRTKS